MLAPPPQECRKHGVNFVSPEHIMLAMLHVPDTLGRKTLERWAAARRMRIAESPPSPAGCARAVPGCRGARSDRRPAAGSTWTST